MELKILDIDNINFSTINIDSIEILQIQKKQSSRKDVVQVGRILKKFKNIKELSLLLPECYIWSEGLFSINQAIQTYDLLQKLDIHLSNSMIGQQIALLIGEVIAKNIHLRYLRIKFNILAIRDGEESEFLVSNLKKCDYLEHLELDLERCLIKNKLLCKLGQSIINLKRLSVLKLNFRQNEVEDLGIIDLSQGIQQCGQNLNVLILDFNQNLLKYESAQKISLAIQSCPQLRILQLFLKENCITKYGVNEIGKAIIQCSYLEELKLSLQHNLLQEGQVLDFGLFNKQNLKNIYLNLTYCLINSNDMYNLSKQISECKQLKIMNLILQRNNYCFESLLDFAKSTVQLQQLFKISINLSVPIFQKSELTQFIRTFSQIKNLIAFDMLIGDYADLKTYNQIAKKYFKRLIFININVYYYRLDYD
ncbi:kinase domain protein, putative (macronuclear) [Tetrahymena thermophila SB210]|uniref:Kinase domain protein, putative n=1 Tax=Tetrahymena thermophila (strain SB210) TaxID=312017 RepID=W7X2Z2_TETTS|nr:kinase domain protein, putative [Tetrahymena thermophila SB210]EWS71807.1 kinase domain protein, putative [Tetrahymena thermophila SB210]|eukprot:XP_012655694.1 kinase domain protein, putative [Tetrahymena thermophila SB210]